MPTSEAFATTSPTVLKYRASMATIRASIGCWACQLGLCTVWKKSKINDIFLCISAFAVLNHSALAPNS